MPQPNGEKPVRPTLHPIPTSKHITFTACTPTPSPGFMGYESPGETEFMAAFDEQSAQNSPSRNRPAASRTHSSRSIPRAPTFTHHPNLSSIDTVVKETTITKVRKRDRVATHQWTWFTMTMATGGIANLLHSLQMAWGDQKWIGIIGLCFYVFNLVLFLVNLALLIARFCLKPNTFIKSFTDQVESLFIPSFVVSIATILINTCEYGIEHCGPWLQKTLEGLFWTYMVFAILSSALMYLVLWSTQVFPIHTMTPVWVFPAYPLLMTAPFAANLIAQSTNQGNVIHSLSIALCAATVQGTGFLISFMVIASFLYRLMTQKLPRDTQRPGVFISIGPSGFTVAGIVHLGTQAKDILPDEFLGENRDLVAAIIKIMSVMVGLWLWGLSIWFFLVSVGSLFKYIRPERRLPFLMTWWSFVFPNTALVTATEQLAAVFDSMVLRIVGSVMGTLLVIVWIIVFFMMVRAMKRKKLLWPEGSPLPK